MKSEFYFEQFYDIPLSCQPPVSIVDRTLNCARAKWDRGDGLQGIRAVSRSYGLASVNSIHGRVHIKPANISIDLLHDDVRRENEVDAFSDGCNDCTKKCILPE